MIEQLTNSQDTTAPIRNLARWTLDDDAVWRDPMLVSQTKLLILDSIACSVAALNVATPLHVAAMLAEIGGNPDCSLIGRRKKSSILAAVLMNGALVRSLDFNDVQFFQKEGNLSVAGHCSDNIPVALAAAERFQSSGQEVIEALAMGYELFKRLRSLMPFTSAWDGTSVSGIVAAAIFGRLAGLDEEKQANALAFGAIRCATPSVVRWGKLSGAKNLANSLIAQSGVQGALLAARGVTGPLEVLDHRGGLHQVFDPALGLESLWADVTNPAYIMTSNIKPYACIGTAQTTIFAALEMHDAIKSRVGDIQRIDVIMADLPMIRKQQGESERRYPKTRETADHSFTFLPAVAMVEGAMSDVQFRNRRWEDPDMVRLIELTELSVDPELAGRAPGSMPSRIKVTFADGSTLENECLYHPGHSFPDRGLDAPTVEAKYREIVGQTNPKELEDRILNSVMCMETNSIEDVMPLLREVQ